MQIMKLCIVIFLIENSNQIIVEYVTIFYSNQIFSFLFKTLMFEYDMRPNLTKYVF